MHVRMWMYRYTSNSRNRRAVRFELCLKDMRGGEKDRNEDKRQRRRMEMKEEGHEGGDKVIQEGRRSEMEEGGKMS